MSYNIPSNISNWKFGRNYEKTRTINENVDKSLPYEVVINSDPARAYLMNTNTFAVQALVISHVIGHVVFFTENRYFQRCRRDIIEYMANARDRVNEYERKYGINIVERTVDAGHALQLHSNPFDEETEQEKRKRIYELEKRTSKPRVTQYGDIGTLSIEEPKESIEISDELYNTLLWAKLESTSPVEPTEDILRYLIDNSRALRDFQKDILEVVRTEGQYYYPVINTKLMNEGFATLIHEHVMNQLFIENLLTQEEHGQFNYSNSLVKAQNKFGINPYLIGSGIWKNIKERWDRGQHGQEWDDCKNISELDKWNENKNEGWDRIKETMRTHNDWFFVQNFLTTQLIDELDLYIYKIEEDVYEDRIVRTEHTPEQIRELIINMYANGPFPKILVRKGDYTATDWTLELEHKYGGISLDLKFAAETLVHIFNMWKGTISLKTKVGKEDLMIFVNRDGQVFTAK